MELSWSFSQDTPGEQDHDDCFRRSETKSEIGQFPTPTYEQNAFSVCFILKLLCYLLSGRFSANVQVQRLVKQKCISSERLILIYVKDELTILILIEIEFKFVILDTLASLWKKLIW